MLTDEMLAKLAPKLSAGRDGIKRPLTSFCEVCNRQKGRGNHAKCSAIKQEAIRRLGLIK